MSFTHTDEQKIVEKSFIIECSKIILTQNIGTDPVIYSGPGSIYQDENYQLFVKIYHIYEDPIDQLRNYNVLKSMSASSGIVEDSHFFKLEAFDMNGKSWVTEKVLITILLIPTFSIGRVINVKIDDISTMTPFSHEKEAISQVVIPGKFNLPYNAWLQEGAVKSLSAIQFELENAKISINRFQGYLEIQICHPLDVSPIKNGLLEALSIAIGYELSPLITYTVANGERTMKIHSSNSSIISNKYSIINSLPGRDAEKLIQFTSCYINTFKSKPNDFYLFWKKVVGAGRTYLEVSWLVVSVSIEGLINDFSKIVEEDPVLKQNCEEAAKEIKASGLINEDVKNKLLVSLAYYPKATPNVILRHLVKKYSLDNNMVKAWGRLRNKSAHADVKSGGKALENNMDNYFLCLKLFYTLFMIKINYRSTFRNFKDNSEIVIHYPA